MILLLVFSFLSGLVTIFAPCIWPLLPILLSTTASGSKIRPLGIVLGLSLSFSIVTLTLSYIVHTIPFDPDVLRSAAALIIGLLGLSLVIPWLSAHLEGWVSRLSGRLGQTVGKQTGFVMGLALGIVWAPCAGPILATIATLAAMRSVSIDIILITLFYVFGVSVPLFILVAVGQRLFQKTKWLNRYTQPIQQAFGVLMIVTAIAIITNYDKVLQVKLLDVLPGFTNWIVDLESSSVIQDQLDTVRGADSTETAVNVLGYPAPELVGITNWLNSEPLTLEQLRGKVVLIDFWTYTCINCIRTLPHVQGWYEQYQDNGLVVIGVHSPEFEFEKDPENVAAAIAQYGLTYPVAQDNDFKTWKNYNNRYWPAKYLIDAQGNIRYTHFGEGEYEQTETAIRQLLVEAGAAITENMLDLPDETPQFTQTPETYLGLGRMDRFASPESPTNIDQTFTFPADLALHNFAYSGSWYLQSQYAEAGVGAQLRIHFKAADVFLVITPAEAGDTITVNGETITLDTDRLYQLYSNASVVDDELTITFNDPGTQVFAFTFGS